MRWWISAGGLHLAPPTVATLVDVGSGDIAWETALVFLLAVLPFAVGALSIPAVALKFHSSSPFAGEARQVPVWVVVISGMSLFIGALPTIAAILLNARSPGIVALSLVGLVFHVAATRVVYGHMRSVATGKPD